MKKFLIAVLALSLAVGVGYFGGTILITKYSFNKVKNEDTSEIVMQSPSDKAFARNDFVWGATVRPYALTQSGSEINFDDLEQQFKFIKDLFPNNPCVRANVERNMLINDKMVELSQKYDVKLYFVLEDLKDFNQSIDYQKSAINFAQTIIPRYKGKVAYYQLSNELSGVVVSKPEDQGKSIDAGYGLSMNSNRYDNVLSYTKAMSKYIRLQDSAAKIIISGHWVLIKPIQDLIKDGVDADIIGWNWGSGQSDNPGIKNIDNYGEMNLPQIAKNMGKEFWIVEANKDDGSMNGKDKEQADYIKMISQKAYSNPDTKGYFHFILTDTIESGAIGQQGLIRVKDGKFYSYKKAYPELKKVAGS